jgi:hypothetical protein
VPLTPQPPAVTPPSSAVVLETTRVAQLTGDLDPEGHPIQNPTSNWGVAGVDLGANTEHDGSLFFFFGDVVVRTEGPAGDNNIPPQDADLVAYTDDRQVSPEGFQLHPTLNGRYFEPFTIAPPFGIPQRDQTPTGAFSFDGRAYVFAVVNDPEDPGGKKLPLSILTSKDHPARPGPYRVEFQFDNFRFWQVAPILVNNASIQGLPLPDGPGLILLGGGNALTGHPDSIQLAWMPLPIIPRGRSAPSGIHYYTGNQQNPWSPQANDAQPLVSLPGYTSVSAAWFPAANKWVMLYSNAGPLNPSGSVIARVGPTPWQWSEEIEIFNPCREGAYGRYMHWPGLDQIWPRIPPDLGDGGQEPGWAYGAFLTGRFCHWDTSSSVLTLHYLLSLSRPYQVQLMRSKVFLTPEQQDS